MSKPITVRHARASAPAASSVTPLARIKSASGSSASNSRPVEKGSRSRLAHVKIRNGAAAASTVKISVIKPLRHLDLNRLIADEISRQLQQPGVPAPASNFDSARVQEARAYAHSVFGDGIKGDNWLLRPSLKFDGVRPIDYLQANEDTNAVYAALDAIAHGFPV